VQTDGECAVLRWQPHEARVRMYPETIEIVSRGRETRAFSDVLGSALNCNLTRRAAIPQAYGEDEYA